VTVQERETLTQLCTLIQSENDPCKFTALVKEIAEFFEQTKRHPDEDQRKDSLP